MNRNFQDEALIADDDVRRFSGGCSLHLPELTTPLFLLLRTEASKENHFDVKDLVAAKIFLENSSFELYCAIQIKMEGEQRFNVKRHSC